MFNAEFFPTPSNIIERMCEGIELQNKVILEPSAGSGAIVDYLQDLGATVICCENDNRLKLIVKSKCKHIADDFLTVTSEQISHINYIIMNPPFSNGSAHILHAYNIAPKGCKIVCLLNAETINNTYTQSRKELKSIIEQFGCVVNLGNCFSEAERKTNVNISLVTIQKAGENYNQEFEGFFMDEDPKEQQENGIMAYNVVRDLVNRYIESIKIYDSQLETAIKLNQMTGSFFTENLGFQITQGEQQISRNYFKKDLQKSGWKYIFSKLNMQKYATKGLMEDINKFVEQQQSIPFTMKNIYKMIGIVIGTTSQRMDKAILEAFDTITLHHADNRHSVKGWKTNSHYLVGKKFILPNIVSPAKEYGYTKECYNYIDSYKSQTIDDMEKALCYANGLNYDDICPAYDSYSRTDTSITRSEKILRNSIDKNTYGEWYESYFFKYKAFKNGNMHFEFKNEDIWATFNQRISKIKGYPLFEGKEQTKYQDRQTGRAYQKKSNPAHAFKPTVLYEF